VQKTYSKLGYDQSEESLRKNTRSHKRKGETIEKIRRKEKIRRGGGPTRGKGGTFKTKKLSEMD